MEIDYKNSKAKANKEKMWAVHWKGMRVVRKKNLGGVRRDRNHGVVAWGPC